MKTVLALCLLLAALVSLPGCPGVEIGGEVEYKGHSYGAACKRLPDGTWSCGVKVHLDEPTEEEDK